MSTRAAVDDFVAQRRLAFVGLSRSGKAFSNNAFRELKAKGYKLLPINPGADAIDGERCYSSFAALPEPVDGALVMVPPEHAERVVREAAAAGVRRVWLQQGADSPQAIRFCTEAGLDVVHGRCILMFAEPVRSFHRFHRVLARLMGRLPQ
jgi:predicted CoA-binding protein